MQGVKVTQTGGFEKVVFESILDTLAGGASIDPSAALTKFPDGIIPAGAIVSVAQSSPAGIVGLHKIVTVTPGTPDTYDFVPLGLVRKDTKIEAGTFVAVVTAGTVRRDAVPTEVKDGMDDLINTVLRRFTAV